MNIQIKILWILFALVGYRSAGYAQISEKQRPNIIILYADDLGYGDIGCYGAKGVRTPNIDKLARNGVRFTDAHSGASTCTPSRFSLLTGKYAFRNKAAILPGDAPLLIDPATFTLPDMLAKAGYATGAVGKWHLGLGTGVVDWNKKISPGPNDIGFQYSFLIPATGDRVPTVYVENGLVVGADPADPIKVSYHQKIGNEPTGIENPELLKLTADVQHSQTIVNGVSRIGYMSGGSAAKWVDEDFADILTNKAVEFINLNKDKPFFLYYAFQDIHVPRLPNKRFQGKSKMGSRGDAIVQMDWVVGAIMKTLKELQLDNNTLVIFSSDNGPVLDDGYNDKAEKLVGRHKPAGPFRGGKYSAFEGGTRMPTITYWKGTIAPSVSDALFTQVDIFASLAKLTGESISAGQAVDSRDALAVLLGKTNKGRSELLEEAFVLALRKDNWKYIEPGTQAPDWLANKKIETGLSDEPKLFNLSSDPGEQKNVYAEYPEILNMLQKRLAEIRNESN